MITASYIEGGESRSIQQPFSLFVSDVGRQNHAPVFHTKTLGPIERDCTLRIPLDIRDPDGHTVASVQIVPEGTTIPDEDYCSVQYGVFEWIPRTGGCYRVQFSATDEYGAETRMTYGVYVLPNALPRILMDYPSSPVAGNDFVCPFTTFDPNEEDSVWVSWTTLYEQWPHFAIVRPQDDFALIEPYPSEEMLIDVSTITWTPSDSGSSETILVEATYLVDGERISVEQAFEVVVTDESSDAEFLSSPTGPARPGNEMVVRTGGFRPAGWFVCD